MARKQEMTKREAEQLLGLSGIYGEDDVKKAYRKKVKACHPDAGGDPAQMVRINQAKDYFDKLFQDNADAKFSTAAESNASAETSTNASSYANESAYSENYDDEERRKDNAKNAAFDFHKEIGFMYDVRRFSDHAVQDFADIFYRFYGASDEKYYRQAIIEEAMSCLTRYYSEIWKSVGTPEEDVFYNIDKIIEHDKLRVERNKRERPQVREQYRRRVNDEFDKFEVNLPHKDDADLFEIWQSVARERGYSEEDISYMLTNLEFPPELRKQLEHEPKPWESTNRGPKNSEWEKWNNIINGGAKWRIGFIVLGVLISIPLSMTYATAGAWWLVMLVVLFNTTTGIITNAIRKALRAWADGKLVAWQNEQFSTATVPPPTGQPYQAAPPTGQA